MANILLVEDDETISFGIRSALAKKGHEVACCSGMEEGKTLFSAKFDLILLDLMLPGMDGFTLLKDLQENAATRYTPVILITSLEGVHNEQKGLIMGAVDYINKPGHPLIVKARVNTHIKLYQYRKQVEYQSMTDQLTGIANRRRYEQYRAEKWGEAVRLRVPISLCMFDIDRFKVYNDTFGHPAGDKVIAAVAKTAAAHLNRSTDFVARYGGEEFVAFMVGEEADKAFEHLRAIRQAVEDLHIKHNSPVCEWVTVSVGGVSLVPKSGDSYETYLKLADTMLYDAKRLGRNRVVWSTARMEELQ